MKGGATPQAPWRLALRIVVTVLLVAALLVGEFFLLFALAFVGDLTGARLRGHVLTALLAAMLLAPVVTGGLIWMTWREGTGPVQRTFLVDSTWTLSRCATPFTALAPDQELIFYDATYPSVFDPGAYLRVQRDAQGHWWCKAANHGWSTDWTQTALPELQTSLYRNRTHQGAGVRLEAAGAR